MALLWRERRSGSACRSLGNALILSNVAAFLNLHFRSFCVNDELFRKSAAFRAVWEGGDRRFLRGTGPDNNNIASVYRRRSGLEGEKQIGRRNELHVEGPYLLSISTRQKFTHLQGDC